MKLRLTKFGRATVKGPLIYICEGVPLRWDKVGDVIEVTDKQGYKALEEIPEYVEEHKEPVKEAPKAKKQKAPRNKMAAAPKVK